ncbi:flagellar hook-length control protein FliK [Pararhizobium haloflavum]|uniref:flagellar hook-length control protein FliK n=1 Tax=Pararhizobium haloflavum TaxID=2037914 RepID=UPI000C196F25|nr:flagellar hook-length control protein FliK [Pararhizobium haloflavum]
MTGPVGNTLPMNAPQQAAGARARQGGGEAGDDALFGAAIRAADERTGEEAGGRQEALAQGEGELVIDLAEGEIVQDEGSAKDMDIDRFFKLLGLEEGRRVIQPRLSVEARTPDAPLDGIRMELAALVAAAAGRNRPEASGETTARIDIEDLAQALADHAESGEQTPEQIEALLAAASAQSAGKGGDAVAGLDSLLRSVRAGVEAQATIEMPRNRGVAVAEGSPAAPNAEGASEDGDTLFRFARAEGTTMPPAMERAATLSASTEVQRPAALKAELAGADGEARLEAVADKRTGTPDFAIVDSRKYLGVALGQTAVASVVGAISDNAEWSAMLRQTAATAATTLDAAKNAASSLKIQLSPPELGSVMATLRMSNGQLSIDLRVETVEAYRQLNDDQNGLLKALRGQGYDVDHVTIQHAGTDRVQAANGNAGSQQSTNLQQGQTALQGEGGSARQQQGRDGQGGFNQPGGRQGESDDRTHERRSSNGIYL